MQTIKVVALTGLLVPAMCLVLTTIVFALPDANCNISTPAPDLDLGTVLVPVSNSGEPCFTEVREGTIYNVSADYANATEERIMDGEITGLSAPECRWTCEATCKAESSVTVTGPGNEASPPIWPSDYRAYAVQQLQVDVRDLNQQGNPILETLSVTPVCQIDYPDTGTLAESAANNEMNFSGQYDSKPLIRLRILSNAEVDLYSKRVEVSLKGSAAQAEEEWDGNLTAWAIGGDDVIPAIIVRQTINQEQAIWEVR